MTVVAPIAPAAPQRRWPPTRRAGSPASAPRPPAATAVFPAAGLVVREGVLRRATGVPIAWPALITRLRIAWLTSPAFHRTSGSSGQIGAELGDVLVPVVPPHRRGAEHLRWRARELRDHISGGMPADFFGRMRSDCGVRLSAATGATPSRARHALHARVFICVIHALPVSSSRLHDGSPATRTDLAPSRAVRAWLTSAAAKLHIRITDWTATDRPG